MAKQTAKNATCEQCRKEMKPGASCVMTHLYADGKWWDRIPVDEDRKDHCGDCNAPGGGYHHPGCDTARCPICGGQEAFCDCEITHMGDANAALHPVPEDEA